ncbi:unnamed protein product, partial [Closterium sp. NIES-64]
GLRMAEGSGADDDALLREFFAEVGAVERDNEVNRVLACFKLNPFEQLNLPFDAKVEDVKKQYRKLIPFEQLNLLFDAKVEDVKKQYRKHTRGRAEGVLEDAETEAAFLASSEFKEQWRLKARCANSKHGRRDEALRVSSWRDFQKKGNKKAKEMDLVLELESRVEQLESANKEQEKEISSLRTQLSMTEESLQREKEASVRLLQLLQQEREARSAMAAVREEDRVLSDADMAALMQKNKELEDVLRRLEEDVEAISQEKESLMKDRDGMAVESSSLCERLEEAEAASEMLKRENENLEAELVAARKSRDTLEEQLAMMNKITSTMSVTDPFELPVDYSYQDVPSTANHQFPGPLGGLCLSPSRLIIRR